MTAVFVLDTFNLIQSSLTAEWAMAAWYMYPNILLHQTASRFAWPFCTTCGRDQYTDRQTDKQKKYTDLARLSVTIARTYAMHTIWANNSHCVAETLNHCESRRLARSGQIGVRKKVKGKVFPYSLPSVGPGADPGVQAVSPQVT